MILEHVHISNGISKLGANIPSVNLPAVSTCRPDAPCYKECYARKGRFCFQKNKGLLERNLEIWEQAPEQFEQDVKIAAFHSRFFRYHSSGDIPDVNYFLMMIRIAKELPNTSFLCFTKRFEIINVYLTEAEDGLHDGIPDNLHIVFSAWGDWLPDNPFHLPEAHIRFKNKPNNYIPACAHQCPKYCGECVMSGCSCWDLKRGESVVFDQH